MEGKSYYIQKLTSEARQGFTSSSEYNSSISGRSNKKTKANSITVGKKAQLKDNLSPSKNSSNISSHTINMVTSESGDPSNYWTIMKKRQNLLKQLKEIMRQQENNALSSQIPNLSVPSNFTNDSAGINGQVISPFLEKKINTEVFNENSKQLNIDAVFNPVTKVNYVIEGADNYIVQSFNEKYKLMENLTSFLDSAEFLETNFPYFHKKWDIAVSEASAEKENLSLDKNNKEEAFYKKYMAKNLLDFVTNLSASDLQLLCTPEGSSHYTGIEIPSSFSESMLPTTLNKDSFEQLFPSGLNVNSKEVVLLEIWTDGSLHPRDALLMALKNLSYAFNPDKVQMTNPIFSDSASYTKIMQNI